MVARFARLLGSFFLTEVGAEGGTEGAQSRNSKQVIGEPFK